MKNLTFASLAYDNKKRMTRGKLFHNSDKPEPKSQFTRDNDQKKFKIRNNKFKINPKYEIQITKTQPENTKLEL